MRGVSQKITEAATATNRILVFDIILLSLLTCFMTSPPTPDAPPNAGHATRCQPRNFIIRNIKLHRGTLWLLTSVTAEMMHSRRVNTALKHFLGHLFYVSDKKTRKLL